MSQDQERLFSTYDLRAVTEDREQEMKYAVAEIPAAALLACNPQSLMRALHEKYRIDAPILAEDQITQDVEEARVDVSGDSNRHILDRSRPVYLPGTEVHIHVPYAGVRQAFQCRPQSFTLNPPRAILEDKALVFVYTQMDPPSEALKQRYQRDLGEVKQSLSQLERDCSAFNSKLEGLILKEIEERRARLQRNQQLAADIGLPLRRRTDAPSTYAVPEVRRKVTPIERQRGSIAEALEPALDEENYEHILSVLDNMVRVMECSPGAFRHLDEEALRFHFLVQLNAQYQGLAGAETFNYEGKTDILLRYNGRNIFIAECLFWDGAASLGDKVDQLLGYTSWRDTKTALIVFNRRKDFSAVAEQIPVAIRSHMNFLRETARRGETSWSFVLHHRDDSHRELMLTVLAFDVPRGD